MTQERIAKEIIKNNGCFPLLCDFDCPIKIISGCNIEENEALFGIPRLSYRKNRAFYQEAKIKWLKNWLVENNKQQLELEF